MKFPSRTNEIKNISTMKKFHCDKFIEEGFKVLQEFGTKSVSFS